MNNTSTASGGGIYNNQASLDISTCNFYENNGKLGGAIGIAGGFDLNIMSSYFVSNTAISGGAISHTATGDSLNIKNSTFTNNNADSGAVVLLKGSAEASLMNCTITKNISNVRGGAVFIEKGRMNVDYTTITKNLSDSIEGGIANNEGELFLKNSVIAENSAFFDSTDISGPIQLKNYNFIGYDPDGIIEKQEGDTIGIVAPIIPLLDTLSYNGGPIIGACIDDSSCYLEYLPTIAFLKDSPLKDNGSPVNQVSPNITDQRGYSRIKGSPNGLTDIGSYELQYTFLEKDTLVACLVEAPLTINPIIIIDSTGGAWRVDNA